MDTVFPGRLDWQPWTPELVSPSVAGALSAWGPADQIRVAAIDPDLSDTAAFCERYDVEPADSANCVVISGKRQGEVRYAACMVLATTRADVNTVARQRLDVRKASFARMDDAVERTGMEYGGITPIGLPAGWPVLVDAAVLERRSVVIGAGIRAAKIALPAALLAELPGAVVVDGLAS